MPTNYPTALDAFTNPDGATDDLDTAGVNHDDQHADANDAVEALQAKVGIVSSAVTTSLDYLVNALVAVAVPKFTAGRYYNAFVGGGDSTTNHSVNVMYALPFLVAESRTFDRIGLEVTTALASSVVRLGIYSSVGGLPVTRVLDAGTIDSTTTGSKEITISQALTPGLYWFIAVQQGGAGSVGVRATGGSARTPLISHSGAPGNENRNGYTDAASVPGALPSTFTAASTVNTPPKIYVRAA